MLHVCSGKISRGYKIFSGLSMYPLQILKSTELTNIINIRTEIVYTLIHNIVNIYNNSLSDAMNFFWWFFPFQLLQTEVNHTTEK